MRKHCLDARLLDLEDRTIELGAFKRAAFDA